MTTIAPTAHENEALLDLWDTIANGADLAAAAEAYEAAGIRVIPLDLSESTPDNNPKGIPPKGWKEKDLGKWWKTADPSVTGLSGVIKGVLLNIDADTPEATVFLSDLIGGHGTNFTTGNRDQAHAGGGHFVIVPPEPLPEGLTARSARKATDYDIDILGTTDDLSILPPTKLPYRDQGYEFNGFLYTPSVDSPIWRWIKEIAAYEKPREQREVAERRDTPHLDAWARDTEWHDLLAEDGWAETAADACGCPTWRHPWGASTPRSATAHIEGCSASESDHPGGALHLWSTTAADKLGGESVSKYQYIAHVRHEGDFGEARAALGIADEPGWESRDVQLDLDVLDEGTWGEVIVFPRLPFSRDRIAPSVETPVATTTDRWIRTATQAAKAGWSTPAPVGVDGKPDTTFSPWDRERFPKGHPCAPDLLQAIFEPFQFTRWVFAQARAFIPHPTGPVALLMTELIRTGMRVPPHIEAMPGTPLSTYVIRVGDSGKGKSLAMNRRRWAPVVTIPENASEFGAVIRANAASALDDHVALGSGEVLADQLVEEVETTLPDGKTGKVRVQKAHCALWVEEPEFRAALRRGKREGSTQFDALNAAWAMENPSSVTRTHGRVELPNPFNVFLTGGMQTSVWGALKEQSTGYLQRCALAAVSDPWRTTSDAICPAPRSGYVPPILPDLHGEHGFTFCQEMRDELELASANAAFEHTATDDEWGSHLLQVRIRLSCLAAIRLDGTTEVTTEIWEWTGLLIEHHRRVLAWLQATEEIERDKELSRLGADRAVMDTAKKYETNTRVTKAARLIEEQIVKGGGVVTKREISKVLWRYKEVLDTSIDALVSKGRVVLERKGKSTVLRFATPTDSVAESKTS